MNAFAIAAGVVAAILLKLGWRPRCPAMVVAGGLWSVYAVYEALVANGVLCDEKCNIRVDLLLLIPILFGMTLYGVLMYRRQHRQNSNPT